MTAKPDRRTERTRAALMAAFVEMLLSEGYEAVTVERIAERANVGRSTFYLHYTGKEDMLRQSITRPSSHLAVIVGGNATPGALAPILTHFREQRKLNRVFFTWPVRLIWEKCLAAMIEPRLAILARHARARPILPLPLVAAAIAESQIGLVANWLMGKTQIQTEAVAEALLVSTHATVAALLRCPPETPLLIPG